MLVLIANESASFREKLVEALSGIPAVEVVGVAENARQAVEQIRLLRPDAVVLDLFMHGGGLHVLHAVRQDEFVPLFVVCTNRMDEKYRTRVTDAGADFFFDKSTEFEKMIGILGELARRGKGRTGPEEG